MLMSARRQIKGNYTYMSADSIMRYARTELSTGDLTVPCPRFNTQDGQNYRSLEGF